MLNVTKSAHIMNRGETTLDPGAGLGIFQKASCKLAEFTETEVDGGCMARSC